MDIEGRKRSLSMSLALFDRCTKLDRTASLSDGMLLQVPLPSLFDHTLTKCSITVSRRRCLTSASCNRPVQRAM